MKNVLHKKKYNVGTEQVHVDPPLIPLLKRKNYEKPDKDCVKIKLRRYPTSQKSELYEFKIVLFYNSDPEELLLLIRNFITTF